MSPSKILALLCPAMCGGESAKMCQGRSVAYASQTRLHLTARGLLSVLAVCVRSAWQLPVIEKLKYRTFSNAHTYSLSPELKLNSEPQADGLFFSQHSSKPNVVCCRSVSQGLTGQKRKAALSNDGRKDWLCPQPCPLLARPKREVPLQIIHLTTCCWKRSKASEALLPGCGRAYSAAQSEPLRWLNQLCKTKCGQGGSVTQSLTEK